MCNSPQRVYILRGVQHCCVWAVGRLGVAACLPGLRRGGGRQAGVSDSLVVSGVTVCIGFNIGLQNLTIN